jgi:hypothetical protein
MEWLSLYLLGSVAMVASALEIAITLLFILGATKNRLGAVFNAVSCVKAGAQSVNWGFTC